MKEIDNIIKEIESDIKYFDSEIKTLDKKAKENGMLVVYQLQYMFAKRSLFFTKKLAEAVNK